MIPTRQQVMKAIFKAHPEITPLVPLDSDVLVELIVDEDKSFHPTPEDYARWDANFKKAKAAKAAVKKLARQKRAKARIQAI